MELPRLIISKTLMQEPRRLKFRVLKLLPHCTKLKMLILTPIFDFCPPYTLMPEPSLANERIDRVEPKFTKSMAENPAPRRWNPRTDIADPHAIWLIKDNLNTDAILLNPQTETEDPNRANERTLIVLPMKARSTTLNLLPSLAYDRKLQVEPIPIESSTDTVPPWRTSPITERMEPILTMDRILIQLPKDVSSFTLKLLPSRMKERTEVEEPRATKFKTEEQLPKRANPRTDNVEPRVMKFSTEQSELKRM
jgi:hypothetical protein